jgi:hypothetical protein
VVALVARQTSSRDVTSWFAARHDDDFASSPWMEAETASALGRLERIGDLSPQEREIAFERANAEIFDVSDSFDISARHFRDATRFCLDRATGLRAPDALHLAVVASTGSCLVSLDVQLLRAARSLGIPALAPVGPA